MLLYHFILTSYSLYTQLMLIFIPYLHNVVFIFRLEWSKSQNNEIRIFFFFVYKNFCSWDNRNFFSPVTVKIPALDRLNLVLLRCPEVSGNWQNRKEIISGLPPNQGNQGKSWKLRYNQGKSGKKYWFNEKSGKVMEVFNFVVFILMFLNILW